MHLPTLAGVRYTHSIDQDTAPQRGITRSLLAVNMVLLRRELGLSQEGLAFQAGLHRTFIAHVERGARNVSIDNIERIAIGLDVHPMVLLAPDHRVLMQLRPAP